ncbi:MAG: TatD family hydrolase [Candidatus Undinarchaeales archaeon]|jgi:TatD DNase family protein|nr:TatD family hydrolase [Candidatus Undinarchaeales archaeon]MDP7493563.1 TatD family hydrolase [Candidatus Undinarchaeales archaeon]
MLIDCHAHISDPAFDGEREHLLDEACAAGLGTVVDCALGPDLLPSSFALADARPDLVVNTLGCDPRETDEETIEEVCQLAERHRDRFVALGEVGLDFARSEPAERERQRCVFARFIELARDLELPLIVHSRSAGKHAVRQLLDAGASRVLLHAYDGRAGPALEGAKAGFVFSVPPRDTTQKVKLVRALPLESLALETDCPALAPERGAVNIPANIVISRDLVARIKNVPPEDVASATTATAGRLFDLPR